MRFLICVLFHDPPPTEIYTLSLHDALPIWARARRNQCAAVERPFMRAAVLALGEVAVARAAPADRGGIDRKSTRLNSSHTVISYAVFCLKKKKIAKLQSDFNVETSSHIEHE